MSEEQKTGSQEPTKESTTAQAVVDEKPKDDYKAKYEAQQAEVQKLNERLKSAQGTLDTLDQYGAIDWDKISGGQQPSEQPAQDNVTRLIQQQEGRILTIQFRQEYPDLKEYENSLVAPVVMRIRQQNPRLSSDDVLKTAAEEVRGFLKKHKDSILEQEQKAKAEADKVKAGGLESSGQTTPEGEPDENELRQNYVNARRERRQQKMGQVP